MKLNAELKLYGVVFTIAA